jgi:hypothetical protein
MLLTSSLSPSSNAWNSSSEQGQEHIARHVIVIQSIVNPRVFRAGAGVGVGGSSGSGGGSGSGVGSGGGGIR